MKLDKSKVWNDVLDSVRVSVSPAIYSTWLSQTHLTSLKKADKTRYKAEVGCSSSYVKQTVEKRYYGMIQDALIEVVGSPCDVSFIVKAEVVPASGEALTPLFQVKNRGQELTELLAKSHIRPGFTFDNFAVSGSNQMAWAATEAISRQPGVGYNPLFIWGGVGVGKTHLMHAVGHKMLSDSSDYKILACTSEEFANDIIEGIRNKTTQAFREKYRKLNALFIDDIQFIAGKDAIQEEFFHTFNSVTGNGGQIILTSDKPPGDIAKLEERLKSRFEAGLIVDIAPPDFELRCAITQIKCDERSLEVDSETVQVIASNLESARKIEGFLIRLSSEIKMKRISPTSDVVSGMLGRGVDGEKQEQTRKSPEAVIEAVCSYYSISKRAMAGKARTKMIAQPRQILMYLLRTELGLPLEEVGRLIGGRDHSTIIHGVDKITGLSSTDPRIREDIMKIKSQIWG